MHRNLAVDTSLTVNNAEPDSGEVEHDYAVRAGRSEAGSDLDCQMMARLLLYELGPPIDDVAIGGVGERERWTS